MVFNSYLFIMLFLPITIVCYYMCLKYKWSTTAKSFLLGMSLWFYGYFHIAYLLLLVGSIVVNYGIHLQLKCNPSKRFVVLGVGLNLGVIFYYKYFDFFLESCNTIVGTEFPLQSIVLPLGISFFTFQQISFLVDTYQGQVEKCSLLEYALFVTFFPQLVAGPIVTHREMLPQFAVMGKNPVQLERVRSGIYLFTVGLAKKVLLADIFGNAVNVGYDMVQALNSTEAILVMVAYSMQLYFDFSGYCDMARGLARMLQLELPTNFDSPYKATDLVEFWERWHITLTRFLTRYLYIPLGGNRVGTMRMYGNIFMVFLASGLWHGAGVTFLVWGILHGVIFILTKACSGLLEHIPRLCKRIVTFSFVVGTFAIFRSESLHQAVTLFRRVGALEWGGIHREIAKCFNIDEFWYLIKIARLEGMPYSYAYGLVMFFALATILIWGCGNTNSKCEQVSSKVITQVLLAILFVWSVVSLSGVSTFLYFNF